MVAEARAVVEEGARAVVEEAVTAAVVAEAHLAAAVAARTAAAVARTAALTGAKLFPSKPAPNFGAGFFWLRYLRDGFLLTTLQWRKCLVERGRAFPDWT